MRCGIVNHSPDSPASQAGGGLFLPRFEASASCASTIHRRRDACPAFRAWRLGRPSIRPNALAPNRAMLKEAKFFRKQAAKAERISLTVSDAEISERFLSMAKAYRSQADVLKSKKLKTKKKSGKRRL